MRNSSQPTSWMTSFLFGICALAMVFNQLYALAALALLGTIFYALAATME